MGRQSRQARRAQERREQQRRQHHKQSQLGKEFIAGIALVVAVLAALLFLVIRGAGSGSSAAGPTPTTIFAEGPVVDGIHCDQGMPAGGFHIHARLFLYRNGKAVTFSPNTGHFYTHDCLYWIHAHSDFNGFIHLEAPSVMHPPLKDYFDIIKETVPSQMPDLTPVPGQPTRVWVGTKPFHGNFMNIRIYNHESITVNIGKPYTGPKVFDFVKAGY
ncbi:MAG TPA: hypothetical protein VKX16_19650 [Chloroflexota bacterium]|nr:hypothetical protein [Chloroflexota bacterium]